MLNLDMEDVGMEYDLSYVDTGSVNWTTSLILWRQNETTTDGDVGSELSLQSFVEALNTVLNRCYLHRLA